MEKGILSESLFCLIVKCQAGKPDTIVQIGSSLFRVGNANLME